MTSEILKTDPKLEDKSAEIKRLVFENYWKPISEIGRHVIALSAERIASEIHRLYGGDETEIKITVLESILNSPSPDDLRPEAIDLITKSIVSGELLYIWTVGDEGSYTDEDKKITYPAFDFQKKKISGSHLFDKLKEEAKKSGINEKKMSESVILSINSKDKREALHRALKNFKDNNVSYVYVVDDQTSNLEGLEQLSLEIGGPQVHTYWINNRSSDGNLAAFCRFMAEKRKEHALEGEKMGLVVDWDDTLYDEQKRVSRSAQMIALELFEKGIQ